ncbi:hypothetical protein [Gimesia chilikensis]|uniref:hypothetical protein n=1 Tax=Gimesia chilikensis TaxID=2605989 RepID=UPI003A952E5F
MVLFFFLAPFAVQLLGGLVVGSVANKIIACFYIKHLTLKQSQAIADTNLTSLNDNIKLIYNDPNKTKKINIGLYNTKSETIEEAVDVKYDGIDNSLENELQRNNNILILN